MSAGTQQNSSPCFSSSTPPNNNKDVTNKANPVLSWGQDKSHVFLTITHSNVETTKDTLDKGAALTCRILSVNPGQKDQKFPDIESKTGSVLWIDGPSHHLTLPLYSSIDIEHSSFRILGDGVTSSAVLKKTVPRNWPRLAQSPQKLHFVKIDWSKWVDNDEDECETHGNADHVLWSADNSATNDSLSSNGEHRSSINDQLSSQHQTNQEPLKLTTTISDRSVQNISPLIPFGEGSSTAIPIETQDCRDLSGDDVPSLLNIQETEKYWKTCLTTPQRLYTLARMWNVIPIGERPNVIHTLVQLMSRLDGQLASHVKGGQEVLRDLLCDEYSNRHITFSQQLVQQLSDIQNQEQRLATLTSLFSLNSVFEQQIICSTFL